MGLPSRIFFSLTEAAARWGCAVADIGGYAVAGHLRIITGINPVSCGAQRVAGLVEVAAADLWPLFRRYESAPVTARVQRLRPIEAGGSAAQTVWQIVTDPPDGITVALADLAILGGDLAAFEADHDPFDRPRRPAQGKYDWEDFWAAVALRLFREGLPESQAAFVAEMQEWFMRRSATGDAPDDRSIRRRITPLWRELSEDL